MKKILILVIILLINLGQLKAQIVFDEVGLGVSYWVRSYSTPDERILLINPPSQNGEINPVIVPHLFGRLRLGEYFGLRGKIGFAKDTYNSSQELGNSVRYERIEQTIIPTGLMIDFSLPLKKGGIVESESDELEEEVIDSKFNLVGGIGVNRYFIQHTFSREVFGSDGSISDAKFSGNDFGIGVMLGLAYQLASRVRLTVFSQYNTGTYLHRLYSEELIGTYETKIISIKGVEFGCSLGYNLSK